VNVMVASVAMMDELQCLGRFMGGVFEGGSGHCRALLDLPAKELDLEGDRDHDKQDVDDQQSDHCHVDVLVVQEVNYLVGQAAAFDHRARVSGHSAASGQMQGVNEIVRRGLVAGVHALHLNRRLSAAVDGVALAWIGKGP
jgi:hypothetical protein